MGVGGPLAAGIQGHTNLTVSGGATVNATNSTSNLIGQNAGSSANVIITGADTSVNFLNNRVLSLGTGLKGPSATPDTATNLVLDILDGAALNTGRGNIAPRFIPIDPDEALPGNITATVNVSGQGSEWNMSSGSLTIGDGATNHGILNISDGGKVNITPNSPFFNAGRNSSVGDITIDGAGSALTLSGSAAFATIGRIGTRTVDITNGGKLIVDGFTGTGSRGFQLGRDANTGADGALNITGPGSKLEVRGTRRGFASISRNNYTSGTLNITQGGKVLQNAGAVNFIGRNVGATGEVNVSGAGSEYAAGRLISIGIQSDENSTGGTDTVNVSDSGLVKAKNMRLGYNGALNIESGVQVVLTEGMQVGMDLNPVPPAPAGLATVSVLGAGSKLSSGVPGSGFLIFWERFPCRYQHHRWRLDGGFSLR